MGLVDTQEAFRQLADRQELRRIATWTKEPCGHALLRLLDDVERLEKENTQLRFDLKRIGP